MPMLQEGVDFGRWFRNTDESDLKACCSHSNVLGYPSNFRKIFGREYTALNNLESVNTSDRLI